MVKHLNTAEFDAIMQDKKGCYVVDFWASWCGPCKMLAPVFEELAEEITDVTFCKVNVDEEAEVALKLRIASIPTVLFVRNGEVTAKAVGYMPKEELADFIQENK